MDHWVTCMVLLKKKQEWKKQRWTRRGIERGKGRKEEEMEEVEQSVKLKSDS